MTNINPSLLKQLNSTLHPSTIKLISHKLQHQSLTKSQSPQKSRLTSSISFASKHSLLQHHSKSRSPQHPHSSQISTSKPNQSQSNQSIQYRNSKGIYYRTNDLPSLHSIDSIMNQCVRHTRTKRVINQYIESGDLLKIKELLVYYSHIESLRLFGTGWKIKSLTVIGCRLKDLSGINGFMNLESLFASYNQIEVLSDLAFNQNLRVVDLEGNMISQMDEVEYLLTIDGLEMVNLDYNPILDKRRKEVGDLLGEMLETEEYDVQGYDFKRKNSIDMDDESYKYENVLLIDHINNQLQSKNSYYQMIDQLKRDKYSDYTQKQFTLDGRFNQQIQQQSQMYLLDDINIFHNPKKALQKDSIHKYLSIKFNLPQETISDPASATTKSKVFVRRASSKKSLENKEQKEYSTISSKMSIKEEFASTTGGQFNPMRSSASNFTDTILSRPDSTKKKFILRKTSLKKDSIISELNTPSSANRQLFSKTNSFLNKQ